MEPTLQQPQIYTFGAFRLDVGEHLLTRAGVAVPLPPKVFETLRVLVENRGHMLEKDEFIKQLWPDTLVEESSLARNISYLRKALGEDADGRQFIETIPKRGYRFTAPVNPLCSKAVALAAATLESPPPACAAPLAPSPRRQPIRSKRMFPFLAVCAVAVLGSTWLYFARASRSASEAVLSPATLRATRLTNTGQFRFPTLSPDGKYLAQVLDDGRRQSLQVRQLATSSSVEIVPPAEVRYRGLTFARDNGALYFVTYDAADREGALYRIPLLGGVAQRLREDVDSPVALAPDGRHLAFIRNVPSRGETVLLVADAAGGAERRLATRRQPQPFSLTGPAWSPDGRQLACVVRSQCDGVAVMDVLAFDALTGAATQLTQQTPGQRWVSIGQLDWTRAGALLAVAWREPTDTFAEQVWRIALHGGAAQPVTNDANSYTGVSATADGRQVVTTQFTRASNLYVAADEQLEGGMPVGASLLGSASVNPGLAWLPDGRIVFGSAASGHADLWLMNADGSARRPLTDDLYTDLQPVVAPDGQSVVFISWRNGQQGLWRMGLDGHGLQRLATGAGAVSPSFSPDGQWLVYDALEAGTPALWRMPARGGAAERLTMFYSWRPVVSPDGRWLACLVLTAPSAVPQLALLPFHAAGQPEPATAPARLLGEVRSPDRITLQWMPDSQALLYNCTHAGVSNLWRQPVHGGAARQLTHFTEDRIFNFAVARDGRIVYERGRLLGDTVLLTAP